MDTLWRALDYVQQGGWIMLPLGLCSLVMWTLIAERLYKFHLLDRRDIEIHDAIRALQEGQLNARRDGLRAVLVHRFLQKRSGDPVLDRRILRECALHQRPSLNGFLASVAVLASVAPLLGLLGTVVGMTQTFDVIAIFGTGNAKALASGISVALITTQSGLLIAIPGMLMSTALGRQASRLEMRLDEVTTILERYV